MKAWSVIGYGNPNKVLKLADIDKPIPKKREVLIKVKATAINDYDWCVVSGKPWEYRLIFGILKPRNPFIGMEVAGVVDSIGPQVAHLKVGDEVFGDISEYKLGTCSEYACSDERAFHKKPAFLSFAEATAIAHAGMLSWQGFSIGGLKEYENVLINGAGGGVGNMALQLAKLKNCKVSGVDTGDKLESMLNKGFDAVYDYKKIDYTELAEKFDFIIDCKTCYAPRKLYRALNEHGRYVSVGGKSGLLVRIKFTDKIGKIFSSKRLKMLILNPNEGMSELLNLMKTGKLKCEIDGPHSFNDIPNQILRFGQGKHLGKIVIQL